MPTIVVVSKKKGASQIEHTVRSREGDIAVEMELGAFLAQAVAALSNVPLTFTKAQLEAKLTAAAAAVIAEMKQSSIHNPPRR